MNETQLTDTTIEVHEREDAEDNKTLYSTSDVAKMCHVHRNTIIAAIRQGKLRAFKTPGGHARVHKDDLAAFCKERNLPVSNKKETDARVVVRNLPTLDRAALLKTAINLKDHCIVEDGYPLVAFDVFPSYGVNKECNYFVGVIQGAAYGLGLEPTDLLRALIDFDNNNNFKKK